MPDRCAPRSLLPGARNISGRWRVGRAACRGFATRQVCRVAGRNGHHGTERLEKIGREVVRRRPLDPGNVSHHGRRAEGGQNRPVVPLLAERVEGASRARAVNGAVHLEQMRGEIDAATVNDDVRVEMAAAPTGSLRLETVNGDAELVTPQLDADLELETMNGEMWSDFPFVAAPGTAARVEKKGSRNVIRIDDGVVIRIGSPARDAPRHRLETLNGDVLIRRTKP